MHNFITFLCTTRNGRTERLTIKKSEFSIGRSKECAVYMPFPEVSRTHCRIQILSDHTVAFTDMRASSVGILHNGKYKKQGILNPGDEFFIGDTRFVLTEFAGNVIVSDASSSDQVRIDDGLSDGLSNAESAMQTALGISLVSGNTQQETGDVMSWSDITAISIAAKNKAPLPTGTVKTGRAQGAPNTLLIGMMVVCLVVAVIACGVAFWAVSRISAAPATPIPSAPVMPAPAHPVAPPVESRPATPAPVTPGATTNSPARAALLTQLKTLQARRDALVRNQQDYTDQAQKEDNLMASQINALDAKIAAETAKEDPGHPGAFASGITQQQVKELQDERERLATDLSSRREIITNNIQQKFTDPLRILDVEMAHLHETLGE